jgi:hypothetical protein
MRLSVRTESTHPCTASVIYYSFVRGGHASAIRCPYHFDGDDKLFAKSWKELQPETREGLGHATTESTDSLACLFEDARASVRQLHQERIQQLREDLVLASMEVNRLVSMSARARNTACTWQVRTMVCRAAERNSQSSLPTVESVAITSAIVASKLSSRPSASIGDSGTAKDTTLAIGEGCAEHPEGLPMGDSVGSGRLVRCSKAARDGAATRGFGSTPPFSLATDIAESFLRRRVNVRAVSAGSKDGAVGRREIQIAESSLSLTRVPQDKLYHNLASGYVRLARPSAQMGNMFL